MNERKGHRFLSTKGVMDGLALRGKEYYSRVTYKGRDCEDNRNQADED